MHHKQPSLEESWQLSVFSKPGKQGEGWADVGHWEGTGQTGAQTQPRLLLSSQTHTEQPLQRQTTGTTEQMGLFLKFFHIFLF